MAAFWRIEQTATARRPCQRLPFREHTCMEHDTGYKRLFSHPEMVADLLRGFVHEPWVAQLDLDSLEPVR